MISVSAIQQADACTGITLAAEDGAVVFGRTQEWGTFDLRSRMVIIPRGYALQTEMPDGKKGLELGARLRNFLRNPTGSLGASRTRRGGTPLDPRRRCARGVSRAMNHLKAGGRLRWVFAGVCPFSNTMLSESVGDGRSVVAFLRSSPVRHQARFGDISVP